MKTKEEYIVEKVKRFEERKKSYQEYIDGINMDIENIQKLSDDDYQKILDQEKMEQEDDEEMDNDLEERLSKIGLTIDDLDGVSLNDITNPIWEKLKQADLIDAKILKFEI